MRSRASSMSASVGAVLVAKLEDLLHYLPNRRQRIELAPLNLVEQAPQLRISLDGPLQMRLRATGRDREHLAREILPPALLEQAVRLQVRAMLSDLRPEHVDVFAARRLREDDGRPPRTLAVEREDRAHLVQHRLRGGVI